MNEILKKPYEISLWDEKLTFVTNKGEFEGSLPEGEYQVLHQYYKERKLAIIGSNTMNTPIRAFQPKLTKNINGSASLTFSIYYRYYDEETGTFLDNPFVPFLVNERKIKLRYGEGTKAQWYDFVIKDVVEDSINYTFSYVARDQFVNELSKTGFEITFANKLENNVGNINYLANHILEESDWKLAEDAALEQTREEPLYEIVLSQEIIAENLRTKKQITIPRDSMIYVFYSVISNKETYFQFTYVVDDKYEIDDRNVITNKNANYYIDVTYDSNGRVQYKGDTLSKYEEIVVSKKYRGNRLVRKPVTKYDSTIDKYVTVYNNGTGSQVYGFTETEYISPTIVSSYVTNPSDYTNDAGWELGEIETIDGESAEFPELNVVMVPDVRDVPLSYEGPFQGLLEYYSTQSNQTLFNSGFSDNRSTIQSISEGQKYVFRVKYGVVDQEGENGRAKTVVTTTNPINLKVCSYEFSRGKYELKDTLFSTMLYNSTNGTDLLNADYIEGIVTCQKGYSFNDLLAARLGIFITFDMPGRYFIKDLQLFPYVLDANDTMCTPGGEVQAVVKTKYYYYYPNKEYKDIKDVEFLYEGYEPNKSFTPVYNTNSFEKIRTMVASESNRFNLIQNLCELFECWARFTIEHKVNGEIALDENYRQKKWISFHEYIGKDNFSGFKYGINLNSIQRQLVSEGIISKIIVKNNANEHGKDGFCSIARADENYCGENFIYDFSYYIQQGLLGFNEVQNDLYMESEAQGYLGYYKALKRQNDKRENLIEEQVGLSTDLPKYQSQYQTYKVSVESAEEQLRNNYLFIRNLTGLTFDDLRADKNNSWWNDKEVISIANVILQLNNTIKRHTELRDKAKTLFDKATNDFKKTKEELEVITETKRELNKKFYKKYSRFIQEGSWIKEDYIDDNLYYLDAESTLHVSSQPKVNYTIKVVEISQIEGFENYDFAVGDKTYIEDTEFFGWNMNTAVPTPYHEEVIVTEITLDLDSPEQNVVKVQNYKTQFEDLFQRITATTQAVEYSTGRYNKVTNVIKEDGTIAIDALQNSMANNSLKLENVKDQSVIWDETGITTTCLTSPNEMVRIISGGIFLSVDGGLTWVTGITGAGINASHIKSGQLDTSVIRIMNGNFPSFRWDTNGINAYSFDVSPTTGEAVSFNYGKFVRFDQYGLYGINGNEGFDPTIPGEDGKKGEDKIRANSDFSLTWTGFQLKSNHQGSEALEDQKGYISITSEKDFQVFDGNGKERIKLGWLDQGNFGLRIFDNNGASILDTSADGALHLRKELKISSTNDNYHIGIGYLNIVAEENLHRTIDVNNRFIVYEDGSIRAKDGTFSGKLEGATGDFTGHITATGGSIGGLTIDQWSSEVGYEVRITSSDGLIFSNDDLDATTTISARLFKGMTEVSEGLTYHWFKNEEPLNDINSATLILPLKNLQNNEIATYTCQINWQVDDGAESKTVSQTGAITIAKVSGGKDGVDAITYAIESSQGFTIPTATSVLTTTLKARIFKGTTELDPEGKWTYAWYQKPDNSPTFTQIPGATKKTLDYELSKFSLYTQIKFTATEI